MLEYEKMTDEQLIAKIRQGDDVSGREECLMRRYKPLVSYLAKDFFLPGGEREDLIQEGMIGLLKALETYREEQGSSFRHFAQICVLGQMKTAIKASQRVKHSWVKDFISLDEKPKKKNDEFQPPLIETVKAGKNNDPEQLFLHKEYLEKIHKKVQEDFSAFEQKVFYLYLQGMDYKTIANILDRSPKSVDNGLQRIKQKMIEILD